MPRLEPLDVERYQGLIGVRRPGDWTGRLEPLAGSEALSEESFVKAWEGLPDDQLTLSGATRIGRKDKVVIQTGPVAERIKINPRLLLRIQPGRIDLGFEADLGDLSRSLDHLRVSVPANLVVLGIEIDGLTDWSRSAPNELLLRFDRPTTRPKKQLRITGWIPVAEHPLESGTIPLELNVPWVEIVAMQNLPGVLTIVSASPIEVAGAQGLIAAATPPAAPGAIDSQDVRMTYRVEDPGRLGILRWNSAPPLVNVQIQSQLTILPESAEWVAVIDYDVLRGSLDSINLRLPTAWASNARISRAGGEQYRPSGTQRPISLWKIVPAHPIWGSQRMILRAAVPLTPGQEIEHPQISPLGQGSVDTTLGLVNLSGTKLTTAGSSGLKPITRAQHFDDVDFGKSPDSALRVYHVEREKWSLKVQIPAQTDTPEGAMEESASVLTADMNLTLSPDLALMGQATYETVTRAGRFLTAQLPEQSSLLWSTVDLNPVSPMKDARGQWLIPLGDPGSHRVEFFWSEAGRPGRITGKGWSVSLPKVGQGQIPTIATIHLPDELVLEPATGTLERTLPDRIDLERADRIARQINESLTTIDRRSGRDRERIAAQLIAHDMALRSAEHSLRASERKEGPARKERAARDLEVIRSTRKAVIESVRAAGLDDAIEAARSYLATNSHSPAANADVHNHRHTRAGGL